jgi:hypothetical protein
MFFRKRKPQPVTVTLTLTPREVAIIEQFFSKTLGTYDPDWMGWGWFTKTEAEKLYRKIEILQKATDPIVGDPPFQGRDWS